MNKKARILLAAMALCAVAWSATAINIVRNPGFEQGSADWKVRYFTIENNALWAHTEPGVARSGCAGAWCVDALMTGSYISQLLPTVAGTGYDLSFWMRSFIGAGEYSVFWDGVLLDSGAAANGAMIQENYKGLHASANATLLEIHGRNDAYYISFDDFQVVQAPAPAAPGPGPAATLPSAPVAALPEPASHMLMFGGLALMGYMLRRRR